MPALDDCAAQVGADGPVTIAGLSTRGGAVPGVRCVTAPSGIDWIQADEMTLCCGAGTPVDDVTAALAEVGQRLALPAGGTIGGALAVLALTAAAQAQTPARDVEWPSYTADLAGSRYRPLDQINASNFKDLEVAWRFKTDAIGH